jgi:hypothetical protein
MDRLTEAINSLASNYEEISNNVKALSTKIKSEDGLTVTVKLIKDILR